ncbi:unnamed protein product, partial [Phaeothamnion confervicola]
MDVVEGDGLAANVSPAADGFVTADEESGLKTFYLNKVIETICKDNREARRQLENVHATARVFFQRFYLSNSVMDYEPKVVMCVLFLLTNVIPCPVA